MQRDEILKYKEKEKIKIFMKNGFVFSGNIESINEESIDIIDKFQNLNTLEISCIMTIGENNYKKENQYAE